MGDSPLDFQSDVVPHQDVDTQLSNSHASIRGSHKPRFINIIQHMTT